MSLRRGTLVLVVGPSGAGKDSLIRGASTRLGHRPEFRFARRVITRAADSGGEDHEAATVEAFAEARSRGEFLLSWHAHGLDYGLPVALAGELEQGRSVIANVSRSVVAEARQRYGPVLVIEVTAPREVLAHRLAERGREVGAEIARRLDRTAAPWGGGDLAICNGGDLAEAVERLVAALEALARHVPARR